MRTAKFFGYLLNPRLHTQVQEEIRHGEGEYKGYISDMAAVVYQNRGVYTGRGIDSSNLVAYYAKQGYPGLKDDTDLRKRHAELVSMLERRNQSSPVYEQIMTEENVVSRKVFTNFLLQNANRILVGSPLPEPVTSSLISNDETV